MGGGAEEPEKLGYMADIQASKDGISCDNLQNGMRTPFPLSRVPRHRGQGVGGAAM